MKWSKLAYRKHKNVENAFTSFESKEKIHPQQKALIQSRVEIAALIPASFPDVIPAELKIEKQKILEELTGSLGGLEKKYGEILTNKYYEEFDRDLMEKVAERIKLLKDKIEITSK